MTDVRAPRPQDGRARLFTGGYNELTLELTLHIAGNSDNAEVWVRIHEQGEPDEGLLEMYSAWLVLRNEHALCAHLSAAIERTRTHLQPFG